MTEELKEPKELTGKEKRMLNLRKFGTPEGNKNQIHNIKGANKAWSIRGSLKYLASQPIDITDPKAMSKLLPEKPTVAQYIAANTLLKATKADMRAVEFSTDQIDGKLAQTNINADLAAILGMSDEQLIELSNATGELDSVTEVDDSEV